MPVKVEDIMNDYQRAKKELEDKHRDDEDMD